MEIKKVLETSVYCRNLKAAEEFYGEVLGLPLYSKSAGRHLFFRCGQGMLLIFNPDSTLTSEGRLPAHGCSGPGHIALAIAPEELTGWKERLRQFHVEIEAEISWPGGGRSLYFRDPEGNSLELTSPQIWGLS